MRYQGSLLTKKDFKFDHCKRISGEEKPQTDEESQNSDEGNRFDDGRENGPGKVIGGSIEVYKNGGSKTRGVPSVSLVKVYVE